MLDESTVATVIAALVAGAAVSKFIVHLSLAPIKSQNKEILETLKKINETLMNFQLLQTEKNGEFVSNEKHDREVGEIYNQIDKVNQRVAKIEGSLQ